MIVVNTNEVKGQKVIAQEQPPIENLTDEIIKYLRDANVPAAQASVIINSDLFNKAANSPLELQKSFLILLFYQIIGYTLGDVPWSIRLCLTQSGEPREWLDNIKVNVLRYILDHDILAKINYVHIKDESSNSNVRIVEGSTNG